MESVASRRTLTANPAECLTFRYHRSNDQVVPFLQFSFEDPRDFRESMVRDAQRNLDRFHRVVRVKLPHHRRVSLGCTRRRCRRRTRLRGGDFTQRLLAGFDPVLFVNRENLLARHRGLVPQGRIRHLEHVLNRSTGIVT